MRRKSGVEESMQIRQVALVARDLEPVVADLSAVLGLGAAFHDPGVGVFGLRNAVLPVGTTFLEVVSPVRADTTAGRFLARRNGDGGYMVILQTDDLDADRRRLAALGIRVVWETSLDDIATVHIHPRDVGAAIVSLDQPRPPRSWRWAGPTWETAAPSDVVRGITGVTLAAEDPLRMARRWAEVLGMPRPTEPVLALDGGAIRFVAATTRGEGIEAVTLAVTDSARVRRVARERGLAVDPESVRIGGTRFEV
jgi:hypothetical protein